MHIKFTWQYLLAFFCLAGVMGIGHELMHHLAGYIICGDWGYKTFNSFELSKGCATNQPQTFWLATLAGPVLFNYIPMWIGYFKLQQKNQAEKLLGLTLIFSVIPIMRIVFSLLGANDEPWIVRHLFGDSKLAFWIMNVVILSITIPPLYAAFNAIQNKRRWLVFLLYLLAFPIFVFFFVGIFLENLIVKYHFLSNTFWGMPLLIIITEILFYCVYFKFKNHLKIPKQISLQ